ncbi:MAG: c-type cytochrome, partial [Gemmatimonadales bacterium]
ARFWFVALALAACGRPQQGPVAGGVLPDTGLRAPDGSVVPAGPLGASILRGRAILLASRDSLPGHAGSALRCTSCHLGDGREPAGMPLTGVYARFPQFRWRTATVQRLEDRINDCLVRSLNGRALAWADPSMRDIVAYLAFLSRGVAVGDSTGLPIDRARSGDTVAGARVYLQRCARCHGADGAGAATGVATYPPLWGSMSFNVGAGMTRIGTLAAFVRRNMPRDMPGTLGETDAINVAAYVASRPRPDFAGKEHDWPCGHRPPDVPYATIVVSCSGGTQLQHPFDRLHQ